MNGNWTLGLAIFYALTHFFMLVTDSGGDTSLFARGRILPPASLMPSDTVAYPAGTATYAILANCINRDEHGQPAAVEPSSIARTGTEVRLMIGALSDQVESGTAKVVSAGPIYTLSFVQNGAQIVFPAQDVTVSPAFGRELPLSGVLSDGAYLVTQAYVEAQDLKTKQYVQPDRGFLSMVPSFVRSASNAGHNVSKVWDMIWKIGTMDYAVFRGDLMIFTMIRVVATGVSIGLLVIIGLYVGRLVRGIG